MLLSSLIAGGLVVAFLFNWLLTLIADRPSALNALWATLVLAAASVLLVWLGPWGAVLHFVVLILVLRNLIGFRPIGTVVLAILLQLPVVALLAGNV